MGETVVIKKYGNRRLYDTERSGYITLNDLEAMVQKGTDVRIVDAKSGADLTKAVLMQIIAERDAAHDVLPLGFLKAIVRHSESPQRGALRDALGNAWQGFVRSQTDIVQQMTQAAFAASPWNMFQGGFSQNAMTPPRPPPSGASPTDIVDQNVRRDREIAELRAQLGQTNQMISALLQAQTAPEKDS